MTRLILVLVLILPSLAGAAKLKPKTERAFTDYVRAAEAEIEQRVTGERKFLWIDEDAARAAKVRAGEVLVGTTASQSMTEVPGGLVHDWTGAAFIKGATLNQVLDLIQDYDHHSRYYAPEVVESKLIERDGNHFKIYYRLLKKKVVTVVLNTEHDVEYIPLDEHRVYSRSYATRISELKNAGTAKEKELADGTGGGYLWRLNSYWRFEERDGGVYVEMRSISLSRGIPLGLGWIVKPIIRDMPRVSMTATLAHTREALRIRLAKTD